MKNVVAVLTALTLAIIVGAYINLIIPSSGSSIAAVKKTPLSTVTNLGLFSDSLSGDTNVTIDTAVARIAGVTGSAEWKSFKPTEYKSAPHVSCVEVVVKTTANKTVMIQFMYNKNTSYVELGAFHINDKPQTGLIARMALTTGQI
ncbi:MAG: hypothetical protein WCK54_18385 [Desulfuromonadales bacterium]